MRYQNWSRHVRSHRTRRRVLTVALDVKGQEVAGKQDRRLSGASEITEHFIRAVSFLCRR